MGSGYWIAECIEFAGGKMIYEAGWERQLSPGRQVQEVAGTENGEVVATIHQVLSP